ncbi:hypothetical protein DRQ21_05535 [Candidatus Fermentibacteria bacterium]|nr:MAG: hypothetical protein DRQ21_05535 [Candidatus Fermentibacteria bacterium]
MIQIFVLTVLAAAGGGFENSLSVRDFPGALCSAGNSDSLRAVVYQNSGDFSLAAVMFQRAFEREPSAGLLSEVWEAVTASDECFRPLSTVGLNEDLKQWGGRLEWSADDLLSLAESADRLGDSLLADSLVLLITDRFPGSLQSSQVISWEFYNNLYPVWYNDSLKIAVLQDFLEEWGNRSDLWRSRAWQYTLAAVTGTSDSLVWKDYLLNWQEACPEDPAVYLTGAAMCIDRDSSWVEAEHYAVEGLELFYEADAPSEVPEEEWALTADALEAGLQFRRLFAMAGQGRRQMALEELAGVISNTCYDINDYHTKSSLFWLQGKLLVAAGDTLSALGSFAEAAAAGDVRNRWSGLAVSSMDSLLPENTAPVQWAREYFRYSGPVFEDCTDLMGPDSLLSGSRVSWCDWNTDGLPDIYVGNCLYQNVEGLYFTDVTGEAGLDSCRGNGGIWGDINNDGLPDLVTSGKPVQVYLNTDGTLQDITAWSGIRPSEASAEGVALLDWNADGWLDLYIASYENGQGTGTEDGFYLGSEQGFAEAGDSLGMVPFLGKPLCGRGVSPCDYDLDGDMDIFVSNYRLQENFLWSNEDGFAVNTALRSGVAGVDVDGWWGHTIGSAWGDYDNDGDWDLFSASLAHPRYIVFSDRSMLLQNTQGRFTDVRAESGIRFEETMSNPVWGDFNNDGLLDLFVTSIYPDRRSFLYLNTGDGRFEDVTWLSGARVFNGWGAAAGDFNLDGSLDVVVGSGDGPTLLRNTTSEGNWILVEVVPPEGVNTSATGCVVTVEQGGVTRMRQVEGGSGTTSQNSGILHFGLSSGTSATVRLYLPGETEPFETVTTVPGTVIEAGSRHQMYQPDLTPLDN